MNEKKREGAFIPCGDSLERMQEISDEQLENASGGADNSGHKICGDSEPIEPSDQAVKPGFQPGLTSF